MPRVNRREIFADAEIQENNGTSHLDRMLRDSGSQRSQYN